jgi:hypothetical protein
VAKAMTPAKRFLLFIFDPFVRRERRCSESEVRERAPVLERSPATAWACRHAQKLTRVDIDPPGETVGSCHPSFEKFRNSRKALFKIGAGLGLCQELSCDRLWVYT